MALVNCPECAYLVSEKARACVNCGYPVYDEANTSRIEPGLRNDHHHEIVEQAQRPQGRASRAAAAFIQVAPLVAALVLVAWWWGAGGIS